MSEGYRSEKWQAQCLKWFLLYYVNKTRFACPKTTKEPFVEMLPSMIDEDDALSLADQYIEMDKPEFDFLKERHAGEDYLTQNPSSNSIEAKRARAILMRSR
jgi:hypothetical protein